MTIPNQTFATKLRRFPRSTNIGGSISSSAIPNPFGNSAEFAEVAYSDQLNLVWPPTIPVAKFFPAVPDVAANGLTIEVWFKAESSGMLVSIPMIAGVSTALAPLLYIDSNGLLRGGLFDSTQVTLISPLQNLIASQLNSGLITVGSLNNVSSPLSVVDGQWHHAALVVQPGSNGTQSLFLDGRLAGTSTANGSFGLSFVASDGTSWAADTNGAIPFGGSITPQPSIPPSPYFLPYAQGFTGCLNEMRCWNGPRTAPQIQQLMTVPLGADLSTYQAQGLFGYVGASQLEALIQSGPYLALTSDAPPFDPFTDVTNRIPGYQNFGIFSAIPFTTAAPEVTFGPSQTYSTKISIWQDDQLQVSFPNQDAAGDNLTGTFSMTLTGAAGGEIQTIDQIAPNSVFTITAPLTDCYRLDFTYSTSELLTVDNLQFMLIPGPNNTLMQLLLDIVPFQTAYTDPDYPITETTVADPRNPGQTVNLNPYWPLFTDQNVFPVNTSNFGPDDLLSAYLNFNEAARTYSLSTGTTFSDFFTLSANQATVFEVSDLSTLLQYAYGKVTGSSAPAEVPTAPFNSANDQIYAFIYNVNAMRQTLSDFLNVYSGWAQLVIDDLITLNIPSTIANQIYDGQERVEVYMKGPSTGDFIANLLITSALWGLGAVAAPALIPATAVAATIAVGFVGSAGANALSELCGGFFGSTTLKAKLSTVSYSTLAEVAQNVATDSATAYTIILKNLLDPAYLQTLYSNYGLLLALSFVNAQPLYDENQNAIKPGANNSLVTGTTYASWKALIPSVFTWSPKQMTSQDSLSDSDVVFKPSEISQFEVLPSGSVPSTLGVFEILQNDPDEFYSMIAKVQEWQTATKSPTGQFFSVCPIFFIAAQLTATNQPVLTAVWVITWSLIDTNKHTISDDAAQALFGIGNPTIALNPVDQNNPLAVARYGWYCQIANGAVTTPFDAFMNWGEGVPAYSPQILLTQLPNNGKLNPAVWLAFPAAFAAAAASDAPASAGVTLAPSALDFGSVTVSATSTLAAVLTNNLKESLSDIAVTSSYPDVFSVTPVQSEVQAGETAKIYVAFTPNTAGEQSGKITVNAKAQFGAVVLTLEFSGTGI